MNDRELLELAAKAAGIDVRWGDGWQSGTMFRSLPRPNSPLVTNVAWNPLTDDGDALRLAVKLGLYLNIYSTSMHQTFAGTGVHIAEEPHGTDPYAATRRAIVRAAAEIAKQQEQPR